MARLDEVMNQFDLFGSPEPAPDRESTIRCARVYIAQARATKFPGWKATLLGWAANKRRSLM